MTDDPTNEGPSVVAAGPLDIANFSRVCIGVSDVDRSLAFYRELLGMDVVFDVELEGPSLEAVTGREGAKGRMVGGLIGGVMVELLGLGDAPEGSRGPRIGYTNISFRIADLDAAYARVLELGHQPGQEPVDIGGVRMFFVSDPDGTPIELIELPAGITSTLELWRGGAVDSM
jgi:glyoxylase I family protein